MRAPTGAQVGDAYQFGLPGKSPLNMYLGWYIKNASGADPILDGNGKPPQFSMVNHLRARSGIPFNESESMRRSMSSVF